MNKEILSIWHFLVTNQSLINSYTFESKSDSFLPLISGQIKEVDEKISCETLLGGHHVIRA